MDALKGAMIIILNCIVTQRMDMNAFSVYRTVQAVQTTRNVQHVSQINGETFVSIVVPVVVTIVMQAVDALKGAMIIILNYIVTQGMDMNAFRVYRTAQAVKTTRNVKLVSQINGEIFANTAV